jgi:hypothetical protein
MVGAVRHPIEVQVNNGGSWVDLLSPIIIACAAIVAALVAAYWQRAQLRHDRLVRDREHGREMIGAAVDAFTKTVIVLVDLRQATEGVDAAEREIEATASLPSSDPKRIAALSNGKKAHSALSSPREAAGEALREMSARYFRLRIALGDKSPVASTYAELSTECRQEFEALTPEKSWRIKREAADAQGTALAKTIPAREGFEDACLAWSAKDI